MAVLEIASVTKVVQDRRHAVVYTGIRHAQTYNLACQQDDIKFTQNRHKVCFTFVHTQRLLSSNSVLAITRAYLNMQR